MTDYAIRITRSFIELGNSIEAIADKCKKVVLYEHEGSRTHCHLLLVECKVSTDTLKNYFKKTLGVVDKADWSFKVCTEFYNRYITYMSKGKYMYKYQKGFEESFLEEKRNEWVEKVVVESPTATKKVKKEYWRIIEEVRSQLTFTDESGLWGLTRKCNQSNTQIYDLLIAKLEENKIRSADFELKRWLHTIVREYDENLKYNVLKSLDRV